MFDDFKMKKIFLYIFWWRGGEGGRGGGGVQKAVSRKIPLVIISWKIGSQIGILHLEWETHQQSI